MTQIPQTRATNFHWHKKGAKVEGRASLALVDCYHSFLILGPKKERIVQVEVTLPVETQERQLLSL